MSAVDRLIVAAKKKRGVRLTAGEVAQILAGRDEMLAAAEMGHARVSITEQTDRRVAVEVESARLDAEEIGRIVLDVLVRHGHLVPGLGRLSDRLVLALLRLAIDDLADADAPRAKEIVGPWTAGMRAEACSWALRSLVQMCTVDDSSVAAPEHVRPIARMADEGA